MRVLTASLHTEYKAAGYDTACNNLTVNTLGGMTIGSTIGCSGHEL